MEPRYAPTKDDKLVPLTIPAVRRLLALAIPYRVPLIFAAVLTLVGAAVNLMLPLVAREGLNRVLEERTAAGLDLLALAIVAIVAIGATIGFVQAVVVARCGHRIVMDLRSRLFGHLQRLPVAYFDRTRSGDLSSRLSNDVTLVQQTLTSDIVNLAANIATLFGGIIVALLIDARLTLVVVMLLAVVMMFFVIFGRRLRSLTRLALDQLSDAMGAMQEALANIRLVKAFARETHGDVEARGKLERLYGLNVRASVWEAAMGAVGMSGFVLLLVGVIWYGGRSVLDGTQTVGSLLAFFITVTIISGPMGSLASLYTRLQRTVGAADRLFELLDESAEPEDHEGCVEFPSGPASVRFDKVSFAYQPEVPVLSDLSLDLPPGQVTALVGRSGGGKTTLASLLYRFYQPQSGSIEVNGVSVDRIRRSSLREHIGLVPQDPVLFTGTILENIRYGRLDATDEEVEAAARSANVHEFVEDLPQRYGTLVGERGITLSGGQRQRVAIARAMLKDPAILVLDEATSSLDARSEALVREALDHLMVGRTTLVIAHRLTTVQNADQIAVVDAGRIAELGTHAELLQAGGLYAELHNLMHTA